MAINENIYFFESFLCRKIPSLSPGGNVASAEMEGGFSIPAADVAGVKSLGEESASKCPTPACCGVSNPAVILCFMQMRLENKLFTFPKEEPGRFLGVPRCLKVRHLEVPRYLVLWDEGNKN